MDEDYRLIYNNCKNVFDEYKEKKEEVYESFKLIGEYLKDKFSFIQGYHIEVNSTFINIHIFKRFNNREDAEKFRKYMKEEGKKELGFTAYYSDEKIQFR